MRRNKNLVITIIVLLLIGGALIAWARLGSDGPLQTWQDTDVACLGGHQNLARHIHPTLTIVVDGEKQQLPGQVGIDPGCMAETHTHERGNRIHIETATAGRMSELTLADFFEVWGQPYKRDGYTETLTVNGEEAADPSEVTFQGSDGDSIRIVYRSEETSATSSGSADEMATSSSATSSENGHSHDDPSLEHSHE